MPHGMKSVFDQTRPDRKTVLGHMHGVSFSGKRDDAFPSGHALHMGALASAAGTLTSLPRRMIRALAIALSLTRIVVLAHWASDVVAGFALGAIIERLLRLWTGYPLWTSEKSDVSIFENVKEYMQRATGLRRPGRKEAPELACAESLTRSASRMTARTQSLAMAVLSSTWRLRSGDGHDPAAVMEDLFEANSWGDTWRDGIYSYVHYHSRIDEVLGIARGRAGYASAATRAGYSR